MSCLIVFIEKYWVVLAAVLSMLIGTAFVIRLISRNVAEKSDVSKSIWSYVFIWPLLLTQKKDGKDVQREFTRNEWIGIIILIVIMLLALIFTPTGRR
jgi:general stress protein CsbA